MRATFTCVQNMGGTSGTVGQTNRGVLKSVPPSQKERWDGEAAAGDGAAFVPPVPLAASEAQMVRQPTLTRVVPLVPPVPPVKTQSWILSGPERAEVDDADDLPEPAHDHSEWAGDFRRWREAECVLDPGSSSGAAVLHRGFCAWCLGREAVPCTLAAFRALLASEGFSVSERGMAGGLLLREDWEACFPPAGLAAVRLLRAAP